MQRTTPPFRADMSAALRRAAQEARATQAGEIAADALKAIEDREIEGVIRKQEDVGLKSVTDGEYRAHLLELRFPRGARQASNPMSASARSNSRERAAAAADPAARHRQARRLQAASDDRAFQVPARAHAADAEDDDPVAVVAAFPLRPRRGAGSDLSVDGTISIAISAQTYRKAVRAFADAGCRYLQLDEVNLAYLCDPALREAHAPTAARIRRRCRRSMPA